MAQLEMIAFVCLPAAVMFWGIAKVMLRMEARKERNATK
jgi:hypothetical protein